MWKLPVSPPRLQAEGRSTPRRRRGSALIIAILVVMVLITGGMGLLSLSVNALRLSKIQRNGSLAINAAESGAERAIRYLREQSSPPADIAPFYPFTGTQTLGDATYTVIVDPDDANPVLGTKRYTITSTGVAFNRRETVRLLVQVGNFGRYVYFTDYEQSSLASGPIWFVRGDVIDGPAHSNNRSNTNFNINRTGSTAAIFRGRLTAAGTTINYSPSRPTTESAWQTIYTEGSRGFQVGADTIPLPTATTEQRDAAWGSDTGRPSTTGVYFPAVGTALDAGIYIRGDATLVFSVTTEGWQRIVITQGTTVKTVVIKRNLNQTTVQTGTATPVEYIGAPNGVIYSTGNLNLQGELADSLMSGGAVTSRNAYTIATDVTSGGLVTITGNLSYRTPPNKTLPWNDPINLRGAALGVVSNTIQVDSGVPNNFTLHGVMLAGAGNTTDGSFYAENHSTRSVGTLNLVGSVIQKRRGPVGTSNNGTIVSGFAKNYRYDARMAVNPPPFFPTTGTYERLSWERNSGSVTGP